MIDTTYLFASAGLETSLLINILSTHFFRDRDLLTDVMRSSSKNQCKYSIAALIPRLSININIRLAQIC